MNPNYKNTIFEGLSEQRFEEFWIITAWNPRGVTNFPLEDNLAADEKLAALIDERNIKRFRIIGLARDESHGEPGWVVQCDEGMAMSIANDFKQEAVFHVAGEAVDLVCCQTGRRHRMPSWNDLLRDPRDVRLFLLSVESQEGGKLDEKHIDAVKEIVSRRNTDCSKTQKRI